MPWGSRAPLRAGAPPRARSSSLRRRRRSRAEARRQRAATAPSRRLRRSARSILPRPQAAPAIRSGSFQAARATPANELRGREDRRRSRAAGSAPLLRSAIGRAFGRGPRRAAGLGRIDPIHLPFDLPGEQEEAVERFDRRRYRLAAIERLERPADLLVQVDVSHWNELRQKQAAVGAANERVGDRPRGAVVGNEQDARASPSVFAAVTGDQPGRERVGECPMRRMV